VCLCQPRLHSALVLQIRRAGFTHPTPIQAQAWPVALSGRDLVAIAKTGSGKTCGFLLPGMLHIQETRKDPRAGPTLLVLAPTRELAVQIKAEADKFGRSSGIRNTWVTWVKAGGCSFETFVNTLMQAAYCTQTVMPARRYSR
jgi:superfamily II DNA/RNA helicase